jgi:hypothetical protein
VKFEVRQKKSLPINLVYIIIIWGCTKSKAAKKQEEKKNNLEKVLI